MATLLLKSPLLNKRNPKGNSCMKENRKVMYAKGCSSQYAFLKSLLKSIEFISKLKYVVHVLKNILFSPCAKIFLSHKNPAILRF